MITRMMRLGAYRLSPGRLRTCVKKILLLKEKQNWLAQEGNSDGIHA